MSTNDIKYHYDQENDSFVKEGQISVNWLLSQVLQIPDIQISKISNEDLQKFLHLLDQSNLRMPDGKHSLIWLKEDLRQKLEMAKGQLGQSWANITERYRFILQQIDFILALAPDIEEKNKTILKEKKKDLSLTPNNMKCIFDKDKQDEEKL